MKVLDLKVHFALFSIRVLFLWSLVFSEIVFAQEKLPADAEVGSETTVVNQEKGSDDKIKPLDASVWDIIAKRAEKAPEKGWNAEKNALAARPGMQAYYNSIVGWVPPEPKQTPGKRRNLGEVPAKPRFELKEKDWPGPGEASVCLWDDDKVAAFSFSIDDNMAQDVSFWKEFSEQFGGLPITWNLIARNTLGASESTKPNIRAGTWSFWRNVLADGYHVASHSMSHCADPVEADGWPGPDWEAAESKRLIEENLGCRVKLFAYPGSPIKEFGISLSWRPSIVKYYAAARGGTGIPVNQANKIDYFNIRTTARPAGLIKPSDPKKADFDITNILNSDQSRKQYKYYRGWATTFIHGVDRGRWNTDPQFVGHQQVFNWVKENKESIWVGFLDDVALYGQERDTATLKVDEATAERIAFTLTSEMDPEVFDYPLTVKVRIPDNWNGASAMQGGKSVPTRILSHDGGLFALVKVVPGSGSTVVKRTTLAHP